MSAHKTGIAAAEPISVRIPQAVRLTGLSRSRIYELMKSGDIEFAKVGSSTFSSLRAFAGSSTAGGRPRRQHCNNRCVDRVGQFSWR